MLILDDSGQNFLQISLSLQLLTPQQLLTLLVISRHLFSPLLEKIELALQVTHLRYLLAEVDKDILICRQLVDGKGQFGEEGMGGEYALV